MYTVIEKKENLKNTHLPYLAWVPHGYHISRHPVCPRQEEGKGVNTAPRDSPVCVTGQSCVSLPRQLQGRPGTLVSSFFSVYRHPRRWCCVNELQGLPFTPRWEGRPE